MRSVRADGVFVDVCVCVMCLVYTIVRGGVCTCTFDTAAAAKAATAKAVDGICDQLDVVYNKYSILYYINLSRSYDQRSIWT